MGGDWAPLPGRSLRNKHAFRLTASQGRGQRALWLYLDLSGLAAWLGGDFGYMQPLSGLYPGLFRPKTPFVY